MNLCYATGALPAQQLQVISSIVKMQDIQLWRGES